MVRDFGDGFEHLLDRYRNAVEKDVEAWLYNKRKLQKDPNSGGIFEELVEIIVSRAWRRMGKLGKFKSEVKRSKWNPEFFQSPEGRAVLRRYEIGNNVQELLRQLEKCTIGDWIEERYERANNHEKDRSLKQIGFGPKSRDVFLRSVGHLDIVPIDIHQRRFLVRTGIFHYYSRIPSCPLEYDDLQFSLVNFSKACLSGLIVKGFDLGENPGIVDNLIWHHCARYEGAVCGKNPRCFFQPSECPLFWKACLWSKMNKTWKSDSFFQPIIQQYRAHSQAEET